MNIPFPNKGGGGNTRRKPMPICYICGRQFSSASIKIHEPQCLKKWKMENDKLPKSMRMPEPIKPKPITPAKEQGLKGSGRYNFDDSGWQAAQANLVPCKSCGRTFAQDRIQTHQRICKRTGVVPPVNQVKPKVSPNSEFARRMGYKPVDPQSKMINYNNVPSKLGLRRAMTERPSPMRRPNRYASAPAGSSTHPHRDQPEQNCLPVPNALQRLKELQLHLAKTHWNPRIRRQPGFPLERLSLPPELWPLPKPHPPLGHLVTPRGPERRKEITQHPEQRVGLQVELLQSSAPTVGTSSDISRPSSVQCVQLPGQEVRHSFTAQLVDLYRSGQ